MINLRPTETFVIARQIDDPKDTNTYYVQAKVRNAGTDELLKTVNLTDNGSQRFRGDYEIPADISGLGFFITITSRIYTDSGYTTESELYGVEEREYLIQERWNASIGGHGGGGGSDVSYKKIRNIFEEELKKLIFPEQKDVDLSIIGMSTQNIIEAIKNIEFPEQKDVDLSEISDLIKGKNNNDVLESIRRIPQTDLSELVSSIKERKSEDKETIKNTGKAVKQIENYLEKIVNKKEKEIKEIIKKIETEDIEKLFKDVELLKKVALAQGSKKMLEEKPEKIQRKLR